MMHSVALDPGLRRALGLQMALGLKTSTGGGVAQWLELALG